MLEIPSKLLFDFDIKTKAEQLFKFAKKDYPNNQWFIEAVYWSDGDYEIMLKTSFSGKIRKYTYRKSADSYSKALTRPFSALGEEVLEEEQLEIKE